RRPVPDCQLGERIEHSVRTWELRCVLNHPGNSNYRKEHADATRQRPIDRRPFCMRYDQDLMRSAIARSRLAVYRGIGHAAHWEGPRRFAGELVAFTKLGSVW